MNITYLANIRLPTEKAHGIQIMETCKALAEAGHRVTLLIPTRWNVISQDPFSFYNIKENFTITKVRTPDLVAFGPVGFLIQSLVFARRALKVLEKNQVDVLYGRDEIPLWICRKIRNVKKIWESHVGVWNFFTRGLINADFRIVAISDGLKAFYRKHGVLDKTLSIIPDGVDTQAFNVTLSKGEVRAQLQLPEEKKIVLYTGHLYARKGVDTLATAAKSLSENIDTYFVGGTEQDIEQFRSRYTSDGIHIVGHVSHALVPLWLRAADVLILPNTAQDTAASLYTSPMKLFEYMASGTPIVSSDVPAVREVLGTETAYFAEPDNPAALARAIREALADLGAQERAKKAQEEALRYDWVTRAEKIGRLFA